MHKLKKSLGQNLLIDKNIINKIISLEDLKNRNILEVGGGTGNLTGPIINKNIKNLVIIEKDDNFCKLLREKFINQKNIKIYNQDILKYNLNYTGLSKAIIFGNLPYNISTQILINFIKVKDWPPFYKKIIFMFQKEVADRILAKYDSKQFGRLAIITNFRLEIVESFKISKNCFYPKPDVDSKIIVFKPRAKIKYEISDIQNLEKITNTFFTNRRKMINKPFAKIFKDYKIVAKKLKINLDARPSELSFEDYFKLTEYFEKTKKKHYS